MPQKKSKKINGVFINPVEIIDKVYEENKTYPR